MRGFPEGDGPYLPARRGIGASHHSSFVDSPLLSLSSFSSSPTLYPSLPFQSIFIPPFSFRSLSFHQLLLLTFKMERSRDGDGKVSGHDPAFPLPADLLHEERAVGVFHLHYGDRKKEIDHVYWCITKQEMCKASKSLSKSSTTSGVLILRLTCINKVEAMAYLEAVMGRCALNQLFLLRARLDVLIASCIAAEENAYARSPEGKGLGHGPGAKVTAALSKLKPKTKLDVKFKVGNVLDVPLPYVWVKHAKPAVKVVEAAQRLQLRYQVGIQGLVTVDGQQRAITAAADNGLWHEDDERLGPSLVVVLEGRKQDGSVSTPMDCLAFMGKSQHLCVEPKLITSSDGS